MVRGSIFTTGAPDLYVPPTFADLRSGRDSALAAALAWPEP
jgi:hypothetical protein